MNTITITITLPAEPVEAAIKDAWQALLSERGGRYSEPGDGWKHIRSEVLAHIREIDLVPHIQAAVRLHLADAVGAAVRVELEKVAKQRVRDMSKGGTLFGGDV